MIAENENSFVDYIMNECVFCGASLAYALKVS